MVLRAILIEHRFRPENRKYTQRLENARTEKGTYIRSCARKWPYFRLLKKEQSIFEWDSKIGFLFLSRKRFSIRMALRVQMNV